MEVVQCAEEKKNYKATAIFGVYESKVWLWQKHKAAISYCEASQKKFTGPKKGRFSEIDYAVFTFFQEIWDRNKLYFFFLWHIQQLYHFTKS
jgi:hypothetical protein